MKSVSNNFKKKSCLSNNAQDTPNSIALTTLLTGKNRLNAFNFIR